MNTTTKKLNNFNESKKFSIKTFSNSIVVHEFHLRQQKNDEYEIHVLGKNGEAKPFYPVSIGFNHSYLGNVRKNLVTDDQGKLYLGKLTDILTVTVVENNRSWRIPNMSDQWCYPGQLDTVVGGKVQIPVA
jgi:hypothetical protein